jgi:hypothetical protein
MYCPECRAEIPLTDVNVATDLALCRRCGKNFSYAEIAAEPEIPIDTSRPPSGAWLQRTARGFEVGASARSPVAFFLVPFMCLWSGLSLGGIYGRQIMRGRFDLAQSLFGLPFLLGTIVLGFVALVTLFGKTSIRVENNLATAFFGIGPIGRRRRFRWDQVTAIRQTTSATRNGQPMYDITIDAERPIRVGWGMRAPRQQFMLAALRQMLRERS